MYRCVVFDLESIPNLEAGRTLLGLGPGVSDVQVREALSARYARANQLLSEVFIKVTMHQIVCIGALYAERDNKNSYWKVTASGTGDISQRSERELVATFVDSLIGTPGPRLIGFNSLGFDLPLLRYRAFAHALPMTTLYGSNARNYWARFGSDHLDLCDAFSSHRLSPPPSLAELASLCNIPAKIGGIDGSQVETLTRAGNVAAVAAYCETDVLATYLLYLRFSLAVGELSEGSYFASLQNLRDFLSINTQKRPHYAAFIDTFKG
jgi:predicted PolB exonuclease-like 3'-5' exonuclease